MSDNSGEYTRFRLFWTDLNGVTRGSSLSTAALETARTEGVNFANAVSELTLGGRTLKEGAYSSATGDMVAVPDVRTVVPLDWRADEAAVFADLETVDGEPFPLCGRSALRRVVADLGAEGYTPKVGIEVEFSLLAPGPDGWVPFSSRSSYELEALEEAAAFIDDLTTAMVAAGQPAAEVHQESQPGQLEVGLEYDDPLHVADGVVFTRHAVKAIARHHGLRATLMPRPHTDEDGNGMHVHVSLWDDAADTNCFAGEGEMPLAGEARQFVGGLLAHMPPLTALCASTVNSYRRLVPGRWAPTTIAWGFDDRSTAVRIPPSRGEHTRIEHRVPDAAGNPYLAVASTLVAGLDGLRNETDPGEPVGTDGQPGDHPTLPRTLWGALERLEEDDLFGAALGETLIAEFLALKRDEFDRAQNAVSRWEVETYRSRF